ncbi:MAG: GAF domain-containing protein [Thermoflexales bacterium]|nr:GAF domain-containing protein [Thermoflexales bacterium]
MRTSLSFLDSLRNRLAAVLVLVAMVPLVLVAVLSYVRGRDSIQELALERVGTVTEASVLQVETFLSQFQSDLLSLSQTPPVQGIIRARDNNGVDPTSNNTYEAWVEQLNTILEPVAKNKKFYRQLRYLDEDGNEMVRVDYRDERVSVASGDELQNEAGATYFIEALKLGPGEMYVSELSLSRKQGQVELPYTPVIHHATPIFDQAGQRRGVFVLNVYADSFLELLKVKGNAGNYLVDQAGYYLHHPVDAQEFGFDLGTGYNVNQDYAWTMGRATGLAAFTAVDPTKAEIVSLRVIRFDPRQTERYWWLMERLPQAEVLASINALGLALGGLVTGVLVVVVLVALWLSRSISLPISVLAKASERIAGGEWDAPLPTTGGAEIRQLTGSFQLMTDQLRETVGELEARVAERTRALETSSAVSRSLSTILDEKQLLAEVVEQVRSAFDYYYAHIYVWDEAHENLLMEGGTGEAGRAMLARGHSIPKGKGLVGRAADSNSIVLVPDTSAEPGWLPNPLLPETRSEVAVPIAIGKQVLGVLDVQHSVRGSLGEAEAQLIQSIANQVAVALQNARAYGQAQRQAGREATANRINQRIREATSIEDVLQVAVRDLAQALGAQRAGIQLKRVAQSYES